MPTNNLITKTINTHVGAGSKLFPESPDDIDSYAPNDRGFPLSPHMPSFVPAMPDDRAFADGRDYDNTRFDAWVEEHGEPREELHPDFFTQDVFDQVAEDRTSPPYDSEPIEPNPVAPADGVIGDMSPFPIR